MSPLLTQSKKATNQTNAIRLKEEVFRRNVADGKKAEVLAAIKEGGIDLSSCGPTGNTALHYACERNNGELIEALIDAGADIDKANAKGLRPYEMSGLDHHYYLLLKERQFRKDVAANNIDKALATICEGEINISSFGASGSTALHYACERNNTEMMMTLVNAGIDLEISNKDGVLAYNSPLLNRENQKLLQAVRKSKQALVEFDQALDKCKHTKSTAAYIEFNVANLEAVGQATKDGTAMALGVLIKTKATLQQAIQEKKFIMGCEATSMLVSSMLMSKQIEHSVEIINASLKSNERMGHAFIALNRNDHHPYTLGSQQSIYIVDPLKGKTFFSYIDESLFSSTDNIVQNKNRSDMRSTLLKRICGDIPTTLDVTEINNFTYGTIDMQNLVHSKTSKEVLALQAEIVTLGSQLIDLMKNGEINVLHREHVPDRFNPK